MTSANLPNHIIYLFRPNQFVIKLDFFDVEYIFCGNLYRNTKFMYSNNNGSFFRYIKFCIELTLGSFIRLSSVFLYNT